MDLIKAAGYEQAIWVGLSMGGYVAMDIQRLYRNGGRTGLV